MDYQLKISRVPDSPEAVSNGYELWLKIVNSDHHESRLAVGPTREALKVTASRILKTSLYWDDVKGESNIVASRQPTLKNLIDFYVLR